MERGILNFLTTYRRHAGPAGNTADCSAIDLLKFPATRGSQRLLKSVFCLGGSEPKCFSAILLLLAMELAICPAMSPVASVPLSSVIVWPIAYVAMEV